MEEESDLEEDFHCYFISVHLIIIAKERQREREKKKIEVVWLICC